jgi:hypothetical protein
MNIIFGILYFIDGEGDSMNTMHEHEQPNVIVFFYGSAALGYYWCSRKSVRPYASFRPDGTGRNTFI